MASPIQLIKDGIQSKDWSLVIEAYKVLSGEDLNSNVEILEQSPVEENPNVIMVAPPHSLPPSSNRHYAGNLFFDNKSVAREDIKIDQKLQKTAYVIESRPQIRYIDVVCRVCGKKESVKQHFAPIRIDKNEESTYVCNNCSSTGCKTAGGKV